MDPVQNAISQAIEATDAEASAAGADDKNKGAGAEGAGTGADDKNKGAGAEAGAEGAGSGDGGAGDGGDGGEELVLADVLEVAPAELDDDQKAFLIENRDDLTGKQVKDLQAAGVDFDADTTPVKGDAVVTDEKKPHDVPADDSDLVLEVEDAEGKVHKITKISDLPTDFVYRDSRQPLEVVDGLNDLKEERAKRAKQREENETLTDSNTTRERVSQIWSGEIAELQEAGDLPAGEIDWQKGDYPNAKAKEQIEGLFTFMAEENQRREEKGLPFVVSLHDVVLLKARADAKVEGDKNKGKTDEEIKAEKDAEAKAKAAKAEKARKVAGANANNEQSGGSDDKPTYVKGSGTSITDIVEEMINESAGTNA